MWHEPTPGRSVSSGAGSRLQTGRALVVPVPAVAALPVENL